MEKTCIWQFSQTVDFFFSSKRLAFDCYITNLIAEFYTTVSSPTFSQKYSKD